MRWKGRRIGPSGATHATGLRVWKSGTNREASCVRFVTGIVVESLMAQYLKTMWFSLGASWDAQSWVAGTIYHYPPR